MGNNNDYDRPSSAWVIADVLSMKKLPPKSDGSASEIAEAEIKIKVLLKSKEQDFLNSDDVNPGDKVSGFLNLEFRRNDHKKTNIYFGGLQKFIPRGDRQTQAPAAQAPATPVAPEAPAVPATASEQSPNQEQVPVPVAAGEEVPF